MIARTASGFFVTVETEPRSAGCDLIVVVCRDGAEELAVPVGSTKLPADELPICEVRSSWKIDPAGVPLRTVVAEIRRPTPAAHDWGGLGLPDGLDTRVVMDDQASLAADAELARRSAGLDVLACNATLGIAPGDRVAGSIVTAVDRRDGIVELTPADGDPFTVTIADLFDTEEQAQ